jgi:hypothetical protein
LSRPPTKSQQTIRRVPRGGAPNDLSKTEHMFFVFDFSTFFENRRRFIPNKCTILKIVLAFWGGIRYTKWAVGESGEVIPDFSRYNQ